MGKIRLYTLAKELGLESKELIVKLRSKGVVVKSALSSVDETVEKAARRIILGDAAVAPVTPTPPVKEKAPEKKSQPVKKAASKEKAQPASKKPDHSRKPKAQTVPKKPADKAPKSAKSTGGKSENKDFSKFDRKGSDKSKDGGKKSHKHGSDHHGKKSKAPVFKAKRIKPDAGGVDLAEIAAADKDIQAVIEKENKLIDIEESVKRRTGDSHRQHHHKKRLSFSGDDDSQNKPHHRKKGSSRGSNSQENTGGYRGKRFGGRKNFNEPQTAAPSGSKARNRKQKAARLEARLEAEQKAAEIERTTLQIGESVVVKELADFMSVSAAELVKKLMGMGVLASINQRVDFDTATLLASDFGFNVVPESDEESNMLPDVSDRDESTLKSRPPVVAVMGHVDHGKTSLLDAIRDTNVADGESGGITQHIGAYQVRLSGGQIITFLDTPGHEAFTAMRAHGAQVTDVAILVVAADDGVKPQTIEAISHVKAADVPIIVALNKMDKPGANPDKVYQELSQHGLLAEDWGGDTIVVKCSAKKGEGIEDILEMIVLQAEMMELKAYREGPATGIVVESRMDKGRGAVATILVRDGILNVGDAFVAGCVSGRVRAMEDYRGRRIKEAVPAQPVEIMGFNGMPDVADSVQVVESETIAKTVAADRALRKRQAVQAVGKKPSLEDLLKKASESETKELLIVLRADVVGSVAAVKESLEKLHNEEGVKVRVIFSGTGTITESDVNFASASGALIVGFHVRPPASVVKLAADEGIEIRLYSIIYKALEDMQDILNGMLKPKVQETVIGSCEVRAIFSVPKLGRVAGCYVTEGMAARNAEVRLIRDGVEKYVGKCLSLRRFKDDAREVQQGYECGIRLENYQDVQEQDVIEFFRIEEVTR